MIIYNVAPVIGTLHDHTGFWIISSFLVIIFLIFFLIDAMVNWEFPITTGYMIGAAVVFICVLIAAYNSFGKGTFCENTPVQVELVDKTYGGIYTAGKHRSVVDLHVIYKTPDGEVSYRRESGKIYPLVATLYKTSCKEI